MCESHSVMSDSLWPHGLYSQWNSPDQNTRVSSCFLLQEIFSTQGSNPDLSHSGWILYQLNHKGSPRILEWVAYPFTSGSSWPRSWTGVSCITGRFFNNWANRETAGLAGWAQFFCISAATFSPAPQLTFLLPRILTFSSFWLLLQSFSIIK